MNIYVLTVRGYTVEQFIAIVNAYVDENIEYAERLIAELPPEAPRQD